MLFTSYYIRDGIARLNNIAKTLETNIGKENPKLDVSYVRNNAVRAAADVKGCLDYFINAMESMYVPSEFYALNAVLPLAIKELTKKEAGEDMKILMDAIKVITATVADVSDHTYEAISTFMLRDRYRYDLKHRSISSVFLENFNDACEHHNGMNVADVSAQYLELLHGFAPECEYNKYAAYTCSWHVNDDDRAMLKRVIIDGEFHKSTVSNETMDIVWCASPISFDKETLDLLNKLERRNIMKALSLVAPDGILIVNMPISFMRLDISTFLAKNLKDVQIRYDNHYEELYIVGKKNTNKNRRVDEKIQSLLHLFVLMDNDKKMEYSIDKPLDKISFVPCKQQVKVFRGSKLDDSELEFLYKNSSCVREMWKDQNRNRMLEATKNPVLPFSIGQLGLILTSGCLDGVIEDEEGKAHVVKGRVVKTEETKRSTTPDGEVTNVTVSANKVQIEMFLPDGEYKRIA